MCKVFLKRLMKINHLKFLFGYIDETLKNDDNFIIEIIKRNGLFIEFIDNYDESNDPYFHPFNYYKSWSF